MLQPCVAYILSDTLHLLEIVSALAYSTSIGT